MVWGFMNSPRSFFSFEKESNFLRRDFLRLWVSVGRKKRSQSIQFVSDAQVCALVWTMKSVSQSVWDVCLLLVLYINEMCPSPAFICTWTQILPSIHPSCPGGLLLIAHVWKNSPRRHRGQCPPYYSLVLLHFDCRFAFCFSSLY